MSKIQINQASKILYDEGVLNQSNANLIGNTNRAVEVADLTELFDDPVFSCFLIDESGSMEPYRQGVIDGQEEMIKILRPSAKCRKGALYVVQYAFNESVRTLNPFSLLSENGNDDVVILKQTGDYNPNSGTALYKSLFNLLQDMAVNIANALQSNVKSTFTIGVITDGEDTEAGIDPSQIRDILKDLTSKNILRSSVIVGLVNSKFTPLMLDELKNRLGFQQAIALNQDPKEIRRAFVLASQSAIQGQTI